MALMQHHRPCRHGHGTRSASSSISPSIQRPLRLQQFRCPASNEQQHSSTAAQMIAAAFSAAVMTSPMAYAPAAWGASAASADIAAQAIHEYQSLEEKGKLKDVKSLESFRQSYGFRRNVNGRVSVKGTSGQWYEVRLDMEVPGAMILQDGNGFVYALETDGLQQVDLSDDVVVMLMFADGDWEGGLSPVEIEADDGKAAQLQMTKKEFREFVGLLKNSELRE